jgi:hypothetical protein
MGGRLRLTPIGPSCVASCELPLTEVISSTGHVGTRSIINFLSFDRSATVMIRLNSRSGCRYREVWIVDGVQFSSSGSTDGGGRPAMTPARHVTSIPLFSSNKKKCELQGAAGSGVFLRLRNIKIETKEEIHMDPVTHVASRLACMALAVIAATGLTARNAPAADINFASNINPQFFGDAAFHTVASLNISVTGASEIVVLFNAECTVGASDDSTYLNIDILVDGVLLAPSNNDNAFCTGTGDGTRQHWVSAETNGARSVGAGTHTVVVRGNLVSFASGETWHIDDLSLVVLESP